MTCQKTVITITVKFEHCNASRFWIGNTHKFYYILFYSRYLATAKMMHHVWNYARGKSYPDECKGMKMVNRIWHFLKGQILNLPSRIFFMVLLWNIAATSGYFLDIWPCCNFLWKEAQLFLFWYKSLTLQPLLNVGTGNIFKLYIARSLMSLV